MKEPDKHLFGFTNADISKLEWLEEVGFEDEISFDKPVGYNGVYLILGNYEVNGEFILNEEGSIIEGKKFSLVKHLCNYHNPAVVEGHHFKKEGKSCFTFFFSPFFEEGEKILHQSEREIIPNISKYNHFPPHPRGSSIITKYVGFYLSKDFSDNKIEGRYSGFTGEISLPKIKEGKQLTLEELKKINSKSLISPIEIEISIYKKTKNIEEMCWF